MKNKNTSLKGQRNGTVGAPPKPVKFPKTKFTISRVVEMNKSVCELTVRKRVSDAIAAGAIVNVGVVKQPKKAAGRPQFSFILKELVGNLKPVAPNVKPAKKVKAVKSDKKVQPVASVPVTVLVSVPTPVASVAVTPTPAPVVNEPVAEVLSTLPV